MRRVSSSSLFVSLSAATIIERYSRRRKSTVDVVVDSKFKKKEKHVSSSEWRWEAEKTRLRRIDYLAYRLGLFSNNSAYEQNRILNWNFPPTVEETGIAHQKKVAGKTGSSSSSSSSKKNKKGKGSKLDALSAQATAHRLGALTTNHSQRSIEKRRNAPHESSSASVRLSAVKSSEDVSAIHPFSTLKEMQALDRAVKDALRLGTAASASSFENVTHSPQERSETKTQTTNASATNFTVQFSDMEETIRQYCTKDSVDHSSSSSSTSRSNMRSALRSSGVTVVLEPTEDDMERNSDTFGTLSEISEVEHPANLFADEKQILFNFGMGEFVSPDAPGFTGLFRQQWQDFHVTEMVASSSPSKNPASLPLLSSSSSSSSTSEKQQGTSEEVWWETQVGAVPLSRVRVYDTPPLPSFLTDTALPSSSDPTSPDLKDFFSVDVETHRNTLIQESLQSTRENSANRASNCSTETRKRSNKEARFYLQCYLHKQHVPHGGAMANLAKTLRVHPRSISVAGIKDFIGDTIQRVRVENVSPASAMSANKIFQNRKMRMSLSHFSYESTQLLPGDLFGNHFKIVLRDVTAPQHDVDSAMETFRENGFPNYYGCQRFSWMGDSDHDAAYAMLHQNWLAFAFRFLNYSNESRTLRELLQRQRQYPFPVQDQYRRNVVRRLRKLAIEPGDLDCSPFLSCPPLSEPVLMPSGTGPNKKQELVFMQLRDAYFDLEVQSRRLSAQRLSSFLWNQALSLRLHHFGGKAVLPGDHVAPAAFRSLASTTEDRQGWFHSIGDVVTPDNVERFRIEDVLHPGFSFEGIKLPENAIGCFYKQICGKYRLDWNAKHSKNGMPDFREPPRPIIRKPLGLKYTYNPELSVLSLEFALERGCYANVAITELMKLTRCAGSEKVALLPAPAPLWDSLGKPDPGYVVSMQDIYDGFEDGVGFVSDTHTVDGPEVDVFSYDGPLFKADEDDDARIAHKWGRRNLIRNMKRRELDERTMQLRLLEKPLADTLSDGEVSRYAGHTVPMQPNAKSKKIFFKVLRRQKRYACAPRYAPRVKLGAQVQNRLAKRPAFRTLNKGSWNVLW